MTFTFYIIELPDIFDSGSQLLLYADDAEIYKPILNRQDKENLQHDLTELNS
jgi:hypothetical protein